jgi:hypothetical protein
MMDNEQWLEYQKTKAWKCMQCGTVSLGSQMLTAPSPFDPEDTLTACPKCKSMDEWKEMCEIDGCDNGATMGMNTENGYKRLCYKHGEKYL